MLNRFCILLAAATMMVSCHNTRSAAGTSASGTPNSLTRAEQRDGWQLLFDGQSKKGWHVFNNKTDGSGWKVEDGTLLLDPQAGKGGELISDSSFENFHLKLDWKLEPNGNSGVMFLCQEDPKYKYAYYTGPEMQIIDNNGHPDAKNIKHRAGDLYDLVSASPENVKPIGEWNTIEIKLNNGALSLYQNGAEVVKTTMWNDTWKSLQANSKFKNSNDFGAFHSGKITLQDHGNKVWFRNIKIKKL